MGFFDKVKNLFTEEVEEDIQPVRKEVRHVEVQSPKVSVPMDEEDVEPVRVQPKVEEKPQPKEDKFVFFSDDDFKDLEKPKREEPKKIEKREEKPLAYRGAVPVTKPEPKKEFKPSPIISPVYGVLDKNYKKDEIKSKKSSPRVYRSSTITIDDIRNKAYGTLEDDIKDDLLGKVLMEQPEENIESDINIFEELEKFEAPDDEVQVISRSTDNVDEIFGKLDNKKEEILDELDNKKDEILDELDNKKESFDLLSGDLDKSDDLEEELIEPDDIDISKTLLEDDDELVETSDVDLSKNLLEDDDLDDDTEELAKELEEQKKKLEKINSMMNENKKATKTKSKRKEKEESEDEDLDESELFDIIDSMYEKKDDE